MLLVPDLKPAGGRTVIGQDNEYGVHDTMRQGLKSVRSTVIKGHPLQDILSKSAETEEHRKYAIAQSVQGFHSVMRMKLDKAYLSQLRRMPVFGSQNLQMDILNGKDNDIDFEDYLNSKGPPLCQVNVSIAPLDSTTMLDVHRSMERAIGISYDGL